VRHVHYDFAGRYQPPSQMPTKAAGVLHCPTVFGEPLRPALEGSQAGAVLRERSAFEELAGGFVDSGDSDRRLVGINSDQDLNGRAPPFRSDLSYCGVREGYFDFVSCTYLF
jgi:hypothetical protein